MRPILGRAPAILAAILFCLLRAWPAAAAEDLVLGMSAAFTGPSSALGVELYRGSMAWFTELNRRGGVAGRRIVISALDDGYNPTPALENTVAFLDRQGVLCLFNYVGTPTVTKVLPLIKHMRRQNVLLFFPFTGAQPQREQPYAPYVFNLRASYMQETSGLVCRFLDLGRSRIAVFYQADAYGRSGWDGVRRSLSSAGRAIVAEATYRRGAGFSESMAEQVRILAAAAPDAIISVGSYAACAAFIRDARDAGLDVPVAHLSFMGSESFLALLAEEGRRKGRDYQQGLIASQVVPSYEDLSLPGVREYRRLMDEVAPAPPPGVPADHAPLRYSFVGFEGFLNARVMTEILRRAGPNIRREDLAAAAQSVHDLDLGIGSLVSFGPGRHQGLSGIYFTTAVNGTFVPVRDWNRWAR